MLKRLKITGHKTNPKTDFTIRWKVYFHIWYFCCCGRWDHWDYSRIDSDCFLSLFTVFSLHVRCLHSSNCWSLQDRQRMLLLHRRRRWWLRLLKIYSLVSFMIIVWKIFNSELNLVLSKTHRHCKILFNFSSLLVVSEISHNRR